MNITPIIAVCSGILVAIFLVWALCKTANDGKAKTEYDERQMIGRRKGYTAGFAAVLINLAILIILSVGNVEIPAEMPVVYFGVIAVGLITSVSVFIFTDSYWGLNNNKQRYAYIFILIGIANLITPIIHMIDGTLIINGKAGTACINLMCAFLFIIIGLESLIKKVLDKRGGDEE